MTVSLDKMSFYTLYRNRSSYIPLSLYRELSFAARGQYFLDIERDLFPDSLSRQVVFICSSLVKF